MGRSWSQVIGNKERRLLSVSGIGAFVVGLAAACSNASDEGVQNGDGDGDVSGSGSSGSVDGGAAGAGNFVASESVARRHSVAELDNSLRDIFGPDSRPASRRLNEDSFDPFDNNYRLQIASAALIDSLELLSEDVAGLVLGDSTFLDQNLPCEAEGPDDEECFAQVVALLGRRAFRRPLSDDEIEPYLSLLDFAAERDEFLVAVELLIRSLVQDPEFLYRIEVGEATNDDDVFALDSNELATKMAYLLWGSSPNDEILEFAAASDLRDSSTRSELAESMLEDDRARAQIHRFHSMWLGYRAIPHGAELVSDFDQETTALLDRVIFEEDRNYLDVFTFDETYLSESLADHYGLDAPDDGPDWVSYGDSGRAGILSHGSVLSGFSKFSDTSPTQRGIFVQTRLLCNDVAPPPPNIDVDQPPGDDEAECKEDRYAQHRDSAGCANCHNLLDPVGMGLENYDMAGVYREHDDGNSDCTISGEGELPDVGPFSGPGELGRMLVDGGLVDACAVEHYLQFALGRELLAEEEMLIETMSSGFQAQGHSFSRLIVDYVASDAFALRKEPK